MVDRVYKKDLPRLRRALEDLRQGFSDVESETDWVGLRVEPLLEHVRSLERLVGSEEHVQEFSRLKRGVVMFHSDLTYLRTNVKALQETLQSVEKPAKQKTRRS